MTWNRQTGQMLVHISGVVLILLTCTFIAGLPALTRNLPPQLVAIYLKALPASLGFQSILIAVIALRGNSTRKWLLIDWISVVCIQCTAILLIAWSGRDYIFSMTGLLVVATTLFRATFLVKLLQIAARKCPTLKPAIFLAIAVFLLLMPLTSWRIAVRPPMGDEPYYLLIAHSLINDMDIDLANNYQNEDSLSFTSQRLVPQAFDDWRNGQLLSRHLPFLPALLIPGFLLGKASGALFTMNLFTAILAAGLFGLLRQFGIPEYLSILAVVLCVMTAPVGLYSVVLFTEIPAATLGVLAVSGSIAIFEKRKYSITSSLVIVIAAAALKTRFLMLCFPPVLIALLFRWKIGRRILAFIGLSLLILSAVGFINFFLYGSPLGRYLISDINIPSGWRVFRGILGLFLDQQYGLFPMNPLYLFAIPGIFTLLHQAGKAKSLIWLSAFIPYVTIIAIYAELTGGICPRGRFLVAWVPLMAIPASMFVLQIKQRLSKSIKISLLVASIMLIILISINPELQIVLPGGTDLLLSRFGRDLRLDLLNIFPSFDRVDISLIWNVIPSALFCVLFPLILFTDGRNHRNIATGRRVQSGLILFLTGVPVSMFILYQFQPPWMDVEDPSFSRHGSAEMFWEEPRSWDENSIPEPSPYRSGIRLHQGDSVVREMPLRIPLGGIDESMALEISARASYPGPGIPILEVFIGDHLLGRIRLNSNQFESYHIPWSYGAMNSLPPIRILHSGNSESDVYIDIDKFRLVQWDHPWPIAPREPHHIFPIVFGDLTIESLGLPTKPIRQGDSFPVQMTLASDELPGNIEMSILFLSASKTYLHAVQPETSSENLEFEVKIPPETGTGQFEVLVQARHAGTTEFISPGGLQLFRVGRRAWTGRIQIDPSVQIAQGTWDEVMVEKSMILRDKLYPIGQTCHLSKNSEITINLEQEIQTTGLIIISHISSVFEEIPWETQIGRIIVSGSEGESACEVMLGRDTAEAMYEFGGKEVRLAHPQAPIAGRIPATLHWPSEFEGMSYDAVYYYSVMQLDRPLPAGTLRFAALDFPGVWNIYAIALIVP